MSGTAILPIAAAVVLLPAGCAQQAGTAAETACTAAPFAPPYRGVDPCSGEAVLTAAATAIFSYRPFVQADQRATFRTARPLLEPDFADRAEPAAALFVPITAATWQLWKAHDATVTATIRVSGDDHPADTATSMSRVLAVDLRPSDAGPAVGFAVYARTTRAGASSPWLISGLEVAA